MTHLQGLPIRARLTLAFTVVMAVVLALAGGFVYWRLRAGLDQALEDALRSRTADVAALVREFGPRRVAAATRASRAELPAQVIDARGRVLGPAGEAPLLRPDELARARRGRMQVVREDRARLLALPVRAAGQDLVVVVRASQRSREHALALLAGALAAGGAVALVLAAAAAYALTGSALRPVEVMRRRARLVSAEHAGERLPLPAADDEVRRLGETLNDMLDRLEAGLVRERTFVADASHELRTPLAILRMELELAERQGRSAGDLRAALRSAAEETDRLTALAEDLLVLARADESALRIDAAATPAGLLLDEVAARFAAQAAAAGRSVGVQAPPDGLAVEVDARRVGQALGNLVDNALRHGAGPVTLRAVATPAGVELHVADGGPGFPDELLPRAFERFARADATRADRGGAGLGLAIARAIARAHGGEAGAANGPQGADVWLQVPRAPAPAVVPG